MRSLSNDPRKGSGKARVRRKRASCKNRVRALSLSLSLSPRGPYSIWDDATVVSADLRTLSKVPLHWNKGDLEREPVSPALSLYLRWRRWTFVLFAAHDLCFVERRVATTLKIQILKDETNFVKAKSPQGHAAENVPRHRHEDLRPSKSNLCLSHLKGEASHEEKKRHTKHTKRPSVLKRPTRAESG